MNRKPWDLGALHADSSMNPMLQSRLPEQIFSTRHFPEEEHPGKSWPARKGKLQPKVAQGVQALERMMLLQTALPSPAE